MRKPVTLSSAALALALSFPAAFSGTAAAQTSSPIDSSNSGTINQPPVDTSVCTDENTVHGILGMSDFTEAGVHCYVVPDNVFFLSATVVGGSGGSTSDNDGDVDEEIEPSSVKGGHGAIVTASRIPVSPGQTLVVYTGADGKSTTFGSNKSATGGDLSRIDNTIVAGGGGAAGGWSNEHTPGGRGGDAGYQGITGQSGSSPDPRNQYGTDGYGGQGADNSYYCLPFGGQGGQGYGDGINGNAGGNGSESSVGTGGASVFHGTGAGGEGGYGYRGGGGGGGGATGNNEGLKSYGAGGGGGAGSSYYSPELDSHNLKDDDTTGHVTVGTASDEIPHVAITAYAPQVSFNAEDDLSFDTQALTTVSRPQTVRISNSGNLPLRIDGLTVGSFEDDRARGKRDDDGTDDFMLTGDTCRHDLQPDDSCTVVVRFVPQTTGKRSASLRVSGNAWNELGLHGTGGVLPKGDTGNAGESIKGDAGTNGTDGSAGKTGATGTAGATGSTGDTGAAGKTGAQGDTGATGATGAAGRDGIDSSTACEILTSKTKDDGSAASVLCTVNAVAGKSGARATLTRNGRTYATGEQRAGKRLKLTLVKGRKLTPGQYRLTRTYRQANRNVTERRQVTVS